MVLQSTLCMMNMWMWVKGKYRLREKAKEEMVKVESLHGVHLVKNSWSQAVAHKDIIVRSIIQGDSQADVLSVARHATILLNAHIQSSPKPRMPRGMRPRGNKKKSNGRSLHGRPKSIRLLKVSKAKVRGLSPRAKVLRDRLHRDHLNPNPLEVTDLNPKPNLRLAPAWQMTSCSPWWYLSQHGPTWRHSSWNGTDYMICNCWTSKEAASFQAR